MPDNPSNWLTLLNNVPPQVSAAIMAMVMAVLRVVYDREETKPIRVVLEALICGALSLTASSGVLALGLSIHWAMFAGGVIGYFGSTTVRTFAVKLINRRIGS